MVSHLLNRMMPGLRRAATALLPTVTPITVALLEKARPQGVMAPQSGRTTRTTAVATGHSGQARRRVAAGDAPGRGHGSQLSFDASVAAPSALRLDSEAQWDRVTKVLDATISGAEKARWAHRSAQEQLDAGDYEFMSLVDDMKDLVPGLADVIGARAGDTVADVPVTVAAQSAGAGDGASRSLRRAEAGQRDREVGLGLGPRGRDRVVAAGSDDVAAKKPVAA